MKKKKISEEDEKILQEIDELSDKNLDKDEKILDLLFKKDQDEDEEIMEYLTDAEKEEYLQMKKSDKKIKNIAIIIISIVVILVIVFLIIFNYFIKSDLEKYTIPLIEDYYNQKYQSKDKVTVSSIGYLKDEEDVDSNIILANMSDGYQVISNDGKIFNDNKTILYNEDGVKYINKLLGSNIINTSIKISYKDYYLKYKMYQNYINILPSGTSFIKLLNEGKLTITGNIIYKKNIDISIVKNLLNKLTDDSIFYLIDSSTGVPQKLTILTKEKKLTFKVDNASTINSNITYYSLDKNINAIEELFVSEVNNNDIEFNDASKSIVHPYSITYDKPWTKKDEEPKSSYYILKFNKDLIDTSNIILFDAGYGYMSEYEENEEPNVDMFNLDDSVYIISDLEFGFASLIKEENDSLLCKLGIC